VGLTFKGKVHPKM